MKQQHLGLLLILGLGLCHGGIAIHAQAYTRLTPHWYATNAQDENEKGLRHLAQHETLEAYHAFSKAIRYRPTGSEAASFYNNLGLCYLQMEKFPLAASSFQYAIRLQPESALYHQHLVRSWLMTPNPTLHLKQLSDYLNFNPQHAEGWYLLGLLYQGLGDTAGQQAAWQQHLLLAPRSPFQKQICQQWPAWCHH